MNKLLGIVLVIVVIIVIVAVLAIGFLYNVSHVKPNTQALNQLLTPTQISSVMGGNWSYIGANYSGSEYNGKSYQPIASVVYMPYKNSNVEFSAVYEEIAYSQKIAFTSFLVTYGLSNYTNETTNGTEDGFNYMYLNVSRATGTTSAIVGIESNVTITLVSFNKTFSKSQGLELLSLQYNDVKG